MIDLSAQKLELASTMQLDRTKETAATTVRPTHTGKINSVPPKEGALGFFFYVPKNASPEKLPFVTIHGISRNATEHIFRFRAFAEEMNVVVIAPVFPSKEHRHFHRYGIGAGNIRADEAFTRTLDSAARHLGVPFDRIRLFGHSAGGQFAHRYLMANPARADRAAIFAPGWYTFPTQDRKFPVGIGGRKSPISGIDKFFDIELAVLVGALDKSRDANLRISGELDLLQGENRVARARSWVAAMRAEAARQNRPFKIYLTEIAGAGHSFRENCAQFDLPNKIFSHLYPEENT